MWNNKNYNLIKFHTTTYGIISTADPWNLTNINKCVKELKMNIKKNIQFLPTLRGRTQ